jgi:hypothetical protein
MLRLRYAAQAGSDGRRCPRLVGNQASARAVSAAVRATAYRSRHWARTLRNSARMVWTRCVRETSAGASATAAEPRRTAAITTRERTALLEAPSPLTRLAVAGRRPEHFLLHPPQECPVGFGRFLSGHVGHDGTSLALVHKEPHRGKGGFAPALARGARLIRNEVELSAATDQAALLRLITGHAKLSGAGCARYWRWGRAQRRPTGRGPTPRGRNLTGVPVECIGWVMQATCPQWLTR